MARSMIDVLEDGARSGGSLTLLTRSGEETRDYAGLIEEAKGLGASLQERGIGPDSRVGLVAVPTMEFVVGLLATMAAQACAVLLPPPPMVGRSSWATRIGSLLRRADASVTLASPIPGSNDVDHLPLSELRPAPGLDSGSGDGPGMILFTSGTTGDPRGVVLSRQRLADRVSADARERGYDPGSDAFLGWRDLSSSAGIFPGLLTPWASGARSCVMETTLFSKAPERWLVEMSNRRVTVSGGPNYAYGAATARLASRVVRDVDLSSWRIAECAGERIDIATARRFIELTRPLGFDPSSFVSLYAMSEAGIISFTRERAGLVFDEAGEAVSVGSIRAGVSVEIVDDDGRAVSERSVGQVKVKTPWLMLGYLTRGEETTPSLDGGWFYTGDLGYVADGDLFVTGRSKNVVIVAGRNYSAEDLERALHGIEGLDSTGIAVVGRPSGSTEEVVVFAETGASTSEHESISRDIRKELWARFLLPVKDVLLVQPGSLPRTSVGKLRRETLKSELSQGDGLSSGQGL